MVTSCPEGGRNSQKRTEQSVSHSRTLLCSSQVAETPPSGSAGELADGPSQGVEAGQALSRHAPSAPEALHRQPQAEPPADRTWL